MIKSKQNVSDEEVSEGVILKQVRQALMEKVLDMALQVVVQTVEWVREPVVWQMVVVELVVMQMVQH